MHTKQDGKANRRGINDTTRRGIRIVAGRGMIRVNVRGIKIKLGKDENITERGMRGGE